METKLMFLDIETTDAPLASVRLEQSFVKPAGNVTRQATKDKQVAEKSLKLQESAALLNSAPIIIIGGIVDGNIFQLAIDKPCHETTHQADVVFFESEWALLTAFKILLADLGDVVFVGHNVERRKDISGFDLPHLRFRFAFHGIPIPACMNPLTTKSIDTMFLAWKSSHNKSLFVTLDEMAVRLGITDKSFPLQGKDIPALWQAGEVEICLLKNLYDLRLTQQVFFRLSALL